MTSIYIYVHPITQYFNNSLIFSFPVFPVISCRDNVSRGNLELCGVTESDSGPIYNDDDIDGYVGSGMEDPPGKCCQFKNF